MRNKDTVMQNDLKSKVEASLDTMRPYLRKDGGDVSVVEITDDYIVKVRLEGACETCPQSFFTMKAGIEEAIKKAVPEIVAVVAVNALKKQP